MKEAKLMRKNAHPAGKAGISNSALILLLVTHGPLSAQLAGASAAAANSGKRD
jgi:hypothetical protein